MSFMKYFILTKNKKLISLQITRFHILTQVKTILCDIFIFNDIFKKLLLNIIDIFF